MDISIEQAVYEYLSENLDVPVNFQVPSGPPDLYVLLEKTGSSRDHGLWTVDLAVQTCGKNLLEVIEENEVIKEVLPGIIDLEDVFRCECQTDYNFTNTKTKEYRYQAVFEIVYKGV